MGNLLTILSALQDKTQRRTRAFHGFKIHQLTTTFVFKFWDLFASLEKFHQGCSSKIHSDYLQVLVLWNLFSSLEKFHQGRKDFLLRFQDFIVVDICEVKDFFPYRYLVKLFHLSRVNCSMCKSFKVISIILNFYNFYQNVLTDFISCLENVNVY